MLWKLYWVMMPRNPGDSQESKDKPEVTLAPMKGMGDPNTETSIPLHEKREGKMRESMHPTKPENAG